MKNYFIGLTARSETHDYGSIFQALLLLKARKVSERVWICSVDPAKSQHIFGLMKQCLAAEDKMIVTEVPEAKRSFQIDRIAA